MSSISNIWTWLTTPSPPTATRNRKADSQGKRLEAKEADKRTDSPLPERSSLKRTREKSSCLTSTLAKRTKKWNMQVTFSTPEPTLVGSIVSSSPSWHTLQGEAVEAEEEGPKDTLYDANNNFVVVDDDDYEYLEKVERRRHIDPVDWNIQWHLKVAEQEHQAAQMRADGWAEDCISLFMLLGRRGLEPLFPRSWMGDFMFPEQTFTLQGLPSFFGEDCGTYPSISSLRYSEQLS